MPMSKHKSCGKAAHYPGDVCFRLHSDVAPRTVFVAAGAAAACECWRLFHCRATSPVHPPDPPRTRTWNLRLRRPTPYPLGQRTSGFEFRARERKPFASCYSVMSACAGILMLLPERSSWQQIAAASCECSRLFHCLPLLLRNHLICPGLEPGISGSGGRGLIH